MRNRTINRRDFLSIAAATAAHGALRAALPPVKPADHTLRIEPIHLELAPGIHVPTISYNGKIPGPLLRLREGVLVSIDVINQSSVPELVHWHGLHIDSVNDGAMEEGSPMIAPQERVTYRFTPGPSGTRWYHTHTEARDNLSRSTYTGQFGFLYVEPKYDSGSYDQEIFLSIHHWEPSLVPMGPPMNALDVHYKYASFDGRLMSASEPIRVRQGQRVLFRLLNASATEAVTLALPGHQFTVIAMDGNKVPQPRPVETITMAVAERLDVIVEMQSPGVWVLGSTSSDDRAKGLGRVVEYAGASGAPVWIDPAVTNWSYLDFANIYVASLPAEEIPMVFAPVASTADKLQSWTVNGKSYPDTPTLKVRQGQRYRLAFTNASGEYHPLHLHRHSFEVVSIAGKKCSGLMKDVVNIPPYSSMKVDFVADNPGKTLFHCHQQLHMDYGFIQLIDYV